MRIPLRHLVPIVTVVLLATVGGSILGDEIILKKGRMRGVVVRRENGQAVINPYNSRNERMTFGLETVPENQIKKVEPDPTPEWRYLESLLETQPPGEEPSIDSHLKMAALAAELGLPDREARHLGEALVLGADFEAAKARYGAAEAERLRKADPRSNQELRADLDALFALEKGSERKAALARVAVDHGFDRSFEYLERVRRSRGEARGRQDDRLLRLRSREEKGVYTLFVPASYDPERSWPLVLGLHGGGPDGKDGKDVVGSGRSAMNFYAQGAARAGYIVVCPDAVQAPWNARPNDSFVMTVLEEVQLSYNIDLNRVYLTGHSMGGFGAWHFGSKYPHLFAVVAPMAGGGFRGLGPFEKTMTPVYLHHGADDPVVGVQGDRQAAEAMRRAEHDFIYTELPDSGHGFPPEIAAEMWRMFHVRRLAVAPKRAEKGKFSIELAALSSFDQPWSKDEETYWGRPGEGLDDDRKSLLERLRLGGAVGREAADRLIAQEEPKSLLSIAGKLVAADKEGLDVRREAARILGATALPEAAKPLLGCLRKPEPDLVPAVAAALEKVGDAKTVKGMNRVFQALSADFDGRLTGKRMRYSDWARSLDAHAALARLVRALGPQDAAGALESSARHLLLEGWEVDRSDRAGLDPDIPLGRCAAAFITALRACESESARECAAAILARHGKLGPVRDLGEDS